MYRKTIFPPELDSIFGNTYRGVPNPNIPHVHPYPTIYHGPNYTVPGVAKLPYRERPYAVAPYEGLDSIESDVIYGIALAGGAGAIVGALFGGGAVSGAVSGLVGAGAVLLLKR